MTVSATPEELLRPEVLAYIAEKGTEEDLQKFGPLIREALQRLDFVWERHARPEQLLPDTDWLVAMFWTGRRWGKTRSSAAWLRAWALSEIGVYAIAAPT